jgi:uncharacterized damage-inducible protein DinB
MPRMDDEIAAYAASIRSRFALLADCIRDFPEGRLNERPIAGGNSAWALVEHTIGNARAWIPGIALGEERGRDRPGEFASHGDDRGALLAQIDAARAEVDAALARLTPERLGVRLTPARELWGEGVPREIAVREAVLQVIEHASLHAGHLHAVRDLLQ